VLELLTYTAGLRLRLKKCQFFKKEARVLGSIISCDGIKMDPAKIKAICQWPQPKDGKALQRFLGAANFHREFSHHYARIAAPLDEIRNIKGPIDWTPERVGSFEELKRLFASDIMLRTINWKEPIYLTTDASLSGIGAWIGQRDSRGLVVPITCVSKKMGSTQQRWSATKRELYALMWGMQKLRHYLLGRQFIARVDHKPLIDLLKNKMTHLLEGWMETVLQFDFTTVYLPGEENEFADALSRAYEITANKISSSGIDSELLFEAAKRGKVIPTPEEQAAMIQRRHLLGHFSVETVTKELWRDGFWWPRMRRDIAAHIAECVACQRFNVVQEGYHPLQSIEADKPWDHLQMDLIGPVPESTEGFKWILTIVDVMTGFTLLRALKTRTMEDIARALWLLICDFGVPRILQSDNGPEFVNHVIKELTNLFGIEQRLITAYNPRADGLVERKNKEVKRLLKKLVVGAFGTWELMLPMTQLSLNITTLQRTGSRPFELLFARPFSTFADWKNTNVVDALPALQQRLADIKGMDQVIWPAVAEKTHGVRQQKQQQHDASAKLVPVLEPGTKVMAVDELKESKWDPTYEGPFTVVRRTRRDNYVLSDATGAILKRNFSIHMLKPIDSVVSGGRDASARNPIQLPQTTTIGAQSVPVSAGTTKDALEEPESEHYEVSDIINHRQDKSAKAHEYLVRWKGYGSGDDSWVHERDFDDIAVIKRYWRKANKPVKPAATSKRRKTKPVESSTRTLRPRK
jgi:transposase InsO family protein